jgi:hypothetical protein
MQGFWRKKVDKFSRGTNILRFVLSLCCISGREGGGMAKPCLQ